MGPGTEMAGVSSQQGRQEASKPKLLDQVRHAIRARHYSKRTEESHVDWIKKFSIFHLQSIILSLNPLTLR
jgi:hypothetical protein